MNMANLQTIVYLSQSSPTTCGSNGFDLTDQTLSILVRHNYPSDTFCNKPVTKTTLQCGDDIYGILDEVSGYLYMYGNGSTFKNNIYGDVDNIALLNYRNIIKTINIDEGITTIAEFFFNGFSQINNIIFPKSLTTIQRAAFRNCTSLETISIPSSITSIGTYPFGSCLQLKEILV